MDFDFNNYQSASDDSEKLSSIQNMKLFSVISWILLSITSLISPFAPSINKYADFKIFWLTLSGQTDGSTSYFPLIIYYGFFYFTFILLITSILASCVVMVFFIFKNPQSLSGMFGQYSKYHFIPILCTTALYITGEASDFTHIFPNHATFIFGLLFTLAGVVSLILIYIKTESSSRYVHYVIKQATYGCLIPLLLYNLFFGISFYGLKIILSGKVEINEKNRNFIKNCYLYFSIALGLINLGLSFAFKNIGIAIANIFIYLGMVIWFFKIPEKQRDQANGIAEGLVDLIMIVLNIGLLIILFTKFKSQVLYTK